MLINMMPKVTIIPLITIIYFTITSCSSDRVENEINDIKVTTNIQRLDVDLFAQNYASPIARHLFLEKKYGSFYNRFVHNILTIPEGNDTTVATNLNLFVNDKEITDVHSDVERAFKNLDDIKSGMEGFQKHLKYYFPSKPIPDIITCITAFNYSVVATDSVIGIGLEMFLGPDAVYYPRLGYPKYMFSKFSREYIVPAAVKGWFQSDYDGSDVKKDLLSQLIYQGKLIYYMKKMLPETNDTLITNYTSEQLKWCDENESKIWSFFIENKLLFNNDPSVFNKFVNDGPTTNGFPKEAPGKIGAYTGWQIVNAYMDKNNSLTLVDLLKENDAQKILDSSGYKPKK